jgi:tetratricopeptide (TPR) repeat protein
VEEKNLIERLDQWYTFLREQEKEKAIELKDEIDPLVTEASDPVLKNTYDLLHVRFYLLVNDLDRAGESLEKLNSFEEQSDNRLNYFYHFFNGMFLYDSKRYRDSINSYLKAEPYLNQLDDRLETAMFKYELAAAYHRANYITLSIDNASEALRLFKDEYHYRKSADCENVLGINFKYIGQYEQAEVHYHNALIYTEKFDDLEVKNAVYKNLGVLYGDQNLSEAAVTYLQKAYNLTSFEKLDRLPSNIFLLAREHFKLGQFDQACRWLEEGLNLCIENQIEEYIHHLKLLQAKYKEEPNFEAIYKQGIDYFKNQELWEYVIEYAEELGTYYRDKGLHKEASSYYYLAIQARKTIEREGALI